MKVSLSSLAKRVTGKQHKSTHRPWLLETRSSTWFITSTVCTAVFTDIFLYAVIVPVFPFSLVDRIGVDKDDVQHWLSILLSVYGAGLIVFAPIIGWLSDRVSSRRTILLAGMLALGGATVMLCLARSLSLLITGRLLQGASAGVVWIVGMALLADTVGNKNTGWAMGFVGSAYSAAALLAPLLGGVVYQQSGYYAVFAVAFGMIVLDIILRLLLIEKKSARQWLTAGEDPTIILPSEFVMNPMTDIQVKSGAPSTDALPTETSPGPDEVSAKRLPPMLILLKSRRMQATFIAATVSAIILTAFDVTLPLFVQDTFHWSPQGAGLIFLAVLSACFVQPLIGRCVDRYGARWIASGGLLICVPPCVCLRLVTYNSMGQKVLLCALLAVIGLGIALTLAAVMAEFTWICVEKERRRPGSMGKGGAYAQSYGLFNVSWALATIVGSYWAGGVRQAAGFGTMGWSLALLCGVSVIPSVLCIGGNIFGRKEQKRASRTIGEE